jgi:hypothetical protein
MTLPEIADALFGAWTPRLHTSALPREADLRERDFSGAVKRKNLAGARGCPPPRA